MASILLALDAGKTSLRVAVFRPDLQELDRWRIPSADVGLALRELRERILSLCREHTIAGVGLSTFGPLDTDPDSPTYGAIPVSSEPAWSGVNLPDVIAKAANRPLWFDYDVNAGALAEHALGAAAGLDRFSYLSIGTGIGAAFYDGGLKPGFAPQFGHTFIPREPDDPAARFAGSCGIHADCLQGLASGRALAERWGRPAEELEPEHQAWDLQARYIARASVNLVYTLAPQRILLASSGALAPGLVQSANHHFRRLLAHFLDPTTAALYAVQPPIVAASLTPDSSLTGAALLARDEAGLLYSKDSC